MGGEALGVGDEPAVTIHVFGESRGNPGLSGIGVVAYGPNGKQQRRISEFKGISTPAHVEFDAVLRALRYLVETGPASAVLMTSHDAPFRQLTGKSKAHLPETMALLAASVETLTQLKDVSFRLVAATDLDLAERLASVAIDTRGRRQAIDY